MTSSAPNPYVALEPRAFWRSGVATAPPGCYTDLFRPRFAITRETRIASAGSCFAQHISRQLKDRGYRFVDVEPPPKILERRRWHEFGFDLFSARYGNIYTARQLRQLFERARGDFRPLDTAWIDKCGVYDPFRPTIEQGGFASVEELEAVRRSHLDAVGRLLGQTEVFIFTFGLTEAWMHKGDGAVYPTCPGTAAGRFDADRHVFCNFSYGEVLSDAEQVIEYARTVNPDIKFLLTVSPVPLTATASGEHALVATTYSKSVLRSVCTTLRDRYDFVDYFPSYEIIASHPSRGMYFDASMRTVQAAGVANVMRTFFEAIGDGDTGEGAASTAAKPAQPPAGAEDAEDVVCDEAILDVFGS